MKTRDPTPEAIRTAAEHVAAGALYETLGLFGVSELPVPIEQVAGTLAGFQGRVIDDRSGEARLRSLLPEGRSGVWIERCSAADRENTILVSAQEPETRRRFTIAHEIGHFLFQRSGRQSAERILAASGVDWSPTPSEEERFANIVAGHLLLPEQALTRVLDGLARSENPLDAWSAASRQCGVSFPALCVALSERRLPSGSEWAVLVADWAVARTQRTGLSLRVRTAATPSDWFLPKNRRLSSIGLANLAREVEAAPLAVERAWSGELEIVHRGTWKAVRRPVVGLFRKYASKGGYAYAAIALRFVGLITRKL